MSVRWIWLRASTRHGRWLMLAIAVAATNRALLKEHASFGSLASVEWSWFSFASLKQSSFSIRLLPASRPRRRPIRRPARPSSPAVPVPCPHVARPWVTFPVPAGEPPLEPRLSDNGCLVCAAGPGFSALRCPFLTDSVAGSAQRAIRDPNFAPRSRLVLTPGFRRDREDPFQLSASERGTIASARRDTTNRVPPGGGPEIVSKPK